MEPKSMMTIMAGTNEAIGMPASSFQRQLHRNPRMVVRTFLVLMVACVVGLVAWKASSAREAALGQARGNLENLTRSLAQHAASTFKAPDVALSGMADLLKYQAPRPERFNAYLL